MKDLKQRVLVSGSLVIVLVCLVLFSANPLVGLLICAFAALLSGIATYEMSLLIMKKGWDLHRLILVSASSILPFAFYAAVRDPKYHAIPYILLFSVFSLLLFLQFRKMITGSIERVALELLALFYVSLPMGLFFTILYPPVTFFSHQDGRIWFFYLIAVTKITDIAAYFVGSRYGKRPFSPLISPKKSWEGAIAGFVAAVLTSLLFHFFTSSAFSLSLLEALWLGALISVAGMFGDLAESLFKRDAMVKDSGFLPGVGGALDLLDSLLVTVPILYFFLTAR